MAKLSLSDVFITEVDTGWREATSDHSGEIVIKLTSAQGDSLKKLQRHVETNRPDLTARNLDLNVLFTSVGNSTIELVLPFQPAVYAPGHLGRLTPATPKLSNNKRRTDAWDRTVELLGGLIPEIGCQPGIEYQVKPVLITVPSPISGKPAGKEYTYDITIMPDDVKRHEGSQFLLLAAIERVIENSGALKQDAINLGDDIAASVTLGGTKRSKGPQMATSNGDKAMKNIFAVTGYPLPKNIRGRG